MAGYSEEMIQEVINGNDIVDVVSSHVSLKRAGRNYMGLCPFHKEKSPSFVVSPDKQIYHCFGCGEGGNALHFIMKIDNMEFLDALNVLADKAGINLVSTNTFVDKQKDIKERIYELNLVAARHFYTNLFSKQGEIALNYLYKRKLDNNIIKKFGLGYSNNTNEMFEYLKSQGFSEDEILKSAIVEKKENRYVDKFRNRLMYPIFDVRERIVAFGGRVLDDSKPKYINSPETIIYSKSKNLYGLNIAKKERLENILIVEGYMDTIALHQRGISNVVASLGTALTTEQAKLLRKYATQIIIGYDADSAGQDATLRGLDILNAAGCEVKVLKLDNDDVKDPDEYIIKYGSGRFENLIKNAITLVEFKLRLLLKKFDINKVDEKIKFLNEMAKVLASIDNEIERDVYVKKISIDTGIGSDPIYAQIQKIKFKYSNDMKNIDRPIVSNVLNNKKNDDDIMEKAEKYIIFLLLERNVEIYNKISQLIPIDYIVNVNHRNIIEKLFEYYKSNEYKIKEVNNIFNNEDEIKIITSTINLEYSLDNIDKTVNDLYKMIYKARLEKRKQEILNQLKDPNLQERDKLELELSKILIELNKR